MKTDDSSFSVCKQHRNLSRVVMLLVCHIQSGHDVVKHGPRFSYGPEERGQRVCHQKSRHKPSPECAASLGLQTLAGTPHFPPFLCCCCCCRPLLTQKAAQVLVPSLVTSGCSQNTSTCVPCCERIGSSLHLDHPSPFTPLCICQSACCSLTGS